jgi:hypothetical protein
MTSPGAVCWQCTKRPQATDADPDLPRAAGRGEAEIETWMMALAEEALKLQRPLSDGILTIVATDERNNRTTE